MKKNMKTFVEDCHAVSEIIGELLMTAIAVLAFAMLAVVLLSYQGTTMPHVDIDCWVDVDDDIINVRHSGGDMVETGNIQIILNLNGTQRVLTPNNVSTIFGMTTWGLGDIIAINTSQIWNIKINSSDYLYVTVVHTGQDIILQSGMLLGDESVVAIPTSTPVPPSLHSAVFTPTTVSDTSGGSATVAQVLTDGDGDFTEYIMPKDLFDENVFQQFNFTPDLNYSPTKVEIWIRHSDNKAEEIKLEVCNASGWQNIPITKSKNWLREEVDVSTHIKTQNEINNLTVRYWAYTTKKNEQYAYIEYIAVYVEWSE
ncbi:MAG: type IV pilin N-terminal domain-containing protein [ANME-2 cluster archaeon]|nr:type IV pilin N-terminal domain-containing protein [ANME-2 cluster archaeon]